MDPRPPFPAGDYWYLGSSDPAIDQLFRRACALAWPYAVYCAKHYHNDPEFAYDLMDVAVENAERYYARFDGKRTVLQLSYRITSVVKRLSKQRANRSEMAVGSVSELELLAGSFAAKPDIEQDAFIRQVLDRMTPRTRQIILWRVAGHTWRQIADELGADHITIWRQAKKEMLGLFELISDTPDAEGRGEKD
jgi:DNA-directed RNA polymerase specialized sigma24 family protein